MIQALSLSDGDVCVFKTLPFTRFSAPDTGRYGVLKVLSAGEAIIYVVLDGVFSQPPELCHVGALPPLHQERFNFSRKPALCSTLRGWNIDLLEFALLGKVRFQKLSWRSFLDFRRWATGAGQASTPKANGDGGTIEKL